MSLRMSNRSTRPHELPFALCVLLALAALPRTDLTAEAEIHRCTQEDGTIAFQETPCPEPSDDGDADTQRETGTPTSSDGFFDFVNPYDEPEEAPLPSSTEPALPKSVSTDRADCEKTTRDAIDAIDMEMREGYSKEDGQTSLAELLELTQQLRACKEL